MKPYLDLEAFAPLWEISEFEQVYNNPDLAYALDACRFIAKPVGW